MFYIHIFTFVVLLLSIVTYIYSIGMKKIQYESEILEICYYKKYCTFNLIIIQTRNSISIPTFQLIQKK